MQVFIYCKFTLHVSGVHRTHHQVYKKLKLQPLVQVMVTVQQPSSNVASLSLSLSNSATAHGGPWPPLAVSSILHSLGLLLSIFYIPASLHLPPLHLPNAVWVYLWGAFLLAH